MRMADPRRRLRVALIGFAVVVTLFAGRLVQLQGIDASTYAQEALDKRIIEVVLPASRGPILDSAGVPLATTVLGFDLVVDQTLMDNPVGAALQLAPILGRDAAKLEQRLDGDDAYVVIQRRLPPEVWREIRALGIRGIYSQDAALRSYPAGPVAGSLVGFVGGFDDTAPEGEPKSRGLSGVEKAYDDLLAGRDGSFSYERDDLGRAIPLGAQERVEAVPGSGLALTINRDLQWHAEERLAAQVKQTGAVSGSAVVVDVQTGEVLAMASVPRFDPRHPARTPKPDRGNRVVEESYEPGSVQKPLTMAAALDSGAVAPDTVLRVPDTLQRGTEQISNWDVHEDYDLTLAGILARSSNTGTVLVGERIPKAVLREYLVDFGYGRKLGMGLPGETPGLLPKNWPDFTRDTISFGQGVAATILHLAGAYATLANDGVRMPLRIVDAVVEPDGTRRELPEGTPTRVVSKETASQVTTMLEAVMQPDGTGANVSVPGYRVAGKTGTAEKIDPATGEYDLRTMSFAGYAPAEDPRLAVVVSIQEPGNGGGGGSVAGPVFSDVMGFALNQAGVAPSRTLPPQVDLYGQASR
jgi:cell division protein FtsI (penicillin-binding protein 3)